MCNIRIGTVRRSRLLERCIHGGTEVLDDRGNLSDRVGTGDKRGQKLRTTVVLSKRLTKVPTVRVGVEVQTKISCWLFTPKWKELKCW